MADLRSEKPDSGVKASSEEAIIAEALAQVFYGDDDPAFAALDRLVSERTETMETLREFNHVEGEPLTEVAAVVVSSYGFAKHRAVVAERERKIAEQEAFKVAEELAEAHRDRRAANLVADQYLGERDQALADRDAAEARAQAAEREGDRERERAKQAAKVSDTFHRTAIKNRERAEAAERQRDELTEALDLADEAFDRHDLWCGYNAEAPGDGSLNRYLAARAACCPRGRQMTREEAVALALDWAEGRRSHTNEMLTAEAGYDHRPQTLAAIAQADAAEVVKWSALAAVLAARPPTEQEQDLGGRRAASESVKDEKLVRDCFDYLPHRVAGSGERYGLLSVKFDEEVAEVKAADIGSEAFVEELGDLVEVCYALGGEEAVEAARVAKKAQRGGFDKLLVMPLALPAAPTRR